MSGLLWGKAAAEIWAEKIIMLHKIKKNVKIRVENRLLVRYNKTKKGINFHIWIGMQGTVDD